MNDFLQSIIDRDPAARSKLSLILTYPGVKAVFFHRIANFFAKAKFNLIARIISQFSRVDHAGERGAAHFQWFLYRLLSALLCISFK